MDFDPKTPEGQALYYAGLYAETRRLLMDDRRRLTDEEIRRLDGAYACLFDALTRVNKRNFLQVFASVRRRLGADTALETDIIAWLINNGQGELAWRVLSRLQYAKDIIPLVEERLHRRKDLIDLEVEFGRAWG